MIISKDNRKRLVKTLLSLKELKSYDEYEIIVVEATDDAGDLEEDIVYIKIPLKDAGFSYQRNIGVERAQGEFIIFIDDDIEITKNWFEALTKPLPQDKFGAMGAVFPQKDGANIVSFSIGVLGHPGGGFRLHSYSKGKEIVLSQVATCNTILRKRIIEEVGMFNLKNRFGSEDSDLSLRVIRSYGKDRFLYRPDALVYHETHRNIIKAVKWYIRRGRADIDLLFIDMIHLSYVFETSLLIKFLILSIVGFIFGFKVFLVGVVLWYLYQIYKYRFMVNYFCFYNFSLPYKALIVVLFPLLKFIFDLSFDLGRIIQIFSFFKKKI